MCIYTSFWNQKGYQFTVRPLATLASSIHNMFFPASALKANALSLRSCHLHVELLQMRRLKLRFPSSVDSISVSVFLSWICWYCSTWMLGSVLGHRRQDPTALSIYSICCSQCLRCQKSSGFIWCVTRGLPMPLWLQPPLARQLWCFFWGDQPC